MQKAADRLSAAFCICKFAVLEFYLALRFKDTVDIFPDPS